MSRRIAVRCLSVALSAALSVSLVGCGGGGGGKGPVGQVNPVAQARKEMFDVVKKESADAFESLETYVNGFEKSLEKDADPEKRWTWPDLNDLVMQGAFSPQTKQAYEKWRAAKVAQEKRR